MHSLVDYPNSFFSQLLAKPTSFATLAENPGFVTVICGWGTQKKAGFSRRHNPRSSSGISHLPSPFSHLLATK
jgi:hypothetical protein